MTCELESFSSSQMRRILALNPYVQEASERYDVPPDLIHAIVWTESRHVPSAVSPKGAVGPMQMMPATSRAMAEAENLPHAPYEPRIGILLGTAFLARLLQRYGGDPDLAAAAYYAGPGRVDAMVPSLAADYVRAVRAARPRFAELDASCAGPSMPARRPAGTRRVPPVPTPRDEPAPIRPPPPSGGAGPLVVIALAALARAL